MKHFTLLFVILLPFACQSLSESEEVQELNEGVWGESGGLAYVQAASRMNRNHPRSEPLDDLDKEALRVVYGGLVDKVDIHWNATPLNEWAADEYGIDIVGEDAEAQAYGYDIYMKGPKSAWKDQHRLETLIHELMHSLQYQQYGESLQDFGNAYFRAYYRGGQEYELNQFELEAIQKADVWVTAVVQEFNKQKVLRKN